MNEERGTAVSHEALSELSITAAQIAELGQFLQELPHPVRIHFWGFADASREEKEALLLCRALAETYEKIELRTFARKASYRYYPVLGFMGLDGKQKIDYGIRIVGLPNGYQLTSLIAAIQATSFRGVTLEPLTRIRLQKLETDVTLELITADSDEFGGVVAKTIFGLATAHQRVRAFLIMANMFPEAAYQNSVYTLPHLVINGRIHLSGVSDEETILKHIALAVKQSRQTGS
jgi:alkyl hydroperoxide reductase subunit AhpF